MRLKVIIVVIFFIFIFWLEARSMMKYESAERFTSSSSIKSIKLVWYASKVCTPSQAR